MIKDGSGYRLGGESFRPKSGDSQWAPQVPPPPPHSKASVKFWEFPNPSAGLRQIFPDASVPCPPRPLGGAAPGTERGKRGRAGGLSSHSREAAAAEPGSAAAAHRPPPAGRSGAARWAERSPGREEAGRRGTANDRAEGRLAQPILELLQHLFPKQTRSGARTERRGLLAHAPPRPRGPQPPCCSCVGRTARHLGPHGRRLPWARVSDDGAAAPPCCPAWEEECRARCHVRLFHGPSFIYCFPQPSEESPVTGAVEPPIFCGSATPSAD
ncbi:uncharacterized protein LOC106981807 [Acinonyx jubatus]|uniref:Uncharacterized protein LOC106981807 n=1 Tax=Acinonyx jubatus TaxID=32536 RepID=A0ABM3P0D3_ACIJB|nr:uncharacterized protein LOC106981807 [Acinonyx jubatus]